MEKWFSFLILCVFVLKCSSSNQPWPLRIDSIGPCCSSLTISEFNFNDSGLLARCLKRNENQSDLHKIHILSLAVPSTAEHGIKDIHLFYPYQFAITGAYCEHQGYRCTFLTQPPSGAVNVTDFRWHKIIALFNSFETWASKSNAIVWIDSDAIVVDFGLSIEKILDLYPHADIILSSDVKLGLINSGFMIFRNTPWSVNFLKLWWEISDKSIVCDQNAFDLAYSKLLPTFGVNGKIPQIQILPTDSLNSHPPAFRYFSGGPILHLMGESAQYRAFIFKKALEILCSARSGGKLPNSLGITADFLQEASRLIYRREIENLYQVANVTGTVEAFEQLNFVSQHYTDVVSFSIDRLYSENFTPENQHLVSDLANEIISIHDSLFSFCLNRIDAIKSFLREAKRRNLDNFASENTNGTIPTYEKLQTSLIDANSTYILMLELVGFQKKAAEAGNSLFWAVQKLEDKLQIGFKILEILDELEQNIVEENKIIPQHMRALLFQNLGVSNYEEHQKFGDPALLSKALHYILKSLEQFALFSFDQNSSLQQEHLESLQLLAAIYCVLQDYGKGLPAWRDAVAKARANLGPLSIGTNYEKLSVVLYNAALCYHQSQENSTAVNMLHESKRILTKLISEYGIEGSSPNFGKQIVDLQNFLQAVNNFLMVIEPEFSDNIHSNLAPDASPNRTLIKGQDGKYYMNVEIDGIEKEGDVGDDYEWEECSEFETDGCETYYVLENTPNYLNSEEMDLYDGLSEEEKEELIDTRRRYSQDTSHFAKLSEDLYSTDNMNDSTKEDLILEISRLRLENQLLKEKLEQIEKIVKS